jgi:hypothetical protein
MAEQRTDLMPPEEQLVYLQEEIGILKLRIEALQEDRECLKRQIQNAWADRDWWRKQAQKWMPSPKRLTKQRLFTVDEWNALPQKLKDWIDKNCLRGGRKNRRA